jgi:D-proline reductase (dithiol) PrdB
MIIGSAKDIVEYCGVPRYLFTDFPLGNPCGKPYDPITQNDIVVRAIALLSSATASRTTVQAPLAWDDTSEWKDNFMKVDASNIEILRELGRQRMAAQAAASERREASDS